MASWQERIDAWLDENRPDYVDVLAKPATKARIEKSAVPPEVAAVFRWHNGQTDEGSTPLVGTLFLLSVDYMDVQRKANLATAKEIGKPDWWKDTWYPFLDDGEGNLICFDASAKNVLYYEHDHPDRSPIAPSVDALFEVLADGLERDLFDEADDFAVPTPGENEAAWQALLDEREIQFPTT